MILLLAAAVALFLQEPPARPAAEQVPALARDLESGDLKKVYRALDRLADLGEAALPALERLAKDAPGRTRAYASLAVEEIRASRARPDLPKIRRVTLKSSDRNVPDLLMELKKSTGATFAMENLFEEERMPQVKVDVQDATMLEALDAICKAGDISIENNAGELELVPGGYEELPRFFYRHYMFRLDSWSRTRTVDFRKPAQEAFRIDMSFLWDPAGRPSKVLPPRVLEAVDDRGRNLVPPPAEAKPGAVEPKPTAAGRAPTPPGQVEGEGELSISVLELLPPSFEAEKLSVVRGVLPLAFPKTRIVVEFPQPIVGAKNEAEGYEVTLKEMNREVHTLEIEIASKTLKPKELRAKPVDVIVHLKGVQRTRAQVLTQTIEGPRVIHVEYETQAIRRFVGGRFQLEEPPAGAEIAKVEVVIVTETVERPVPFEFRDVKIK